MVELAFRVIHLNKSTMLAFEARTVVHNLITYHVNPSVRINILLDTPLNNDQPLNVHSPAGIRQYYVNCAPLHVWVW